MTTLFVNNLTVIDASLLDPQRGLLGQSWLLDVELEGSLDQQGMLLDFAEVKRRIKYCVDQEFDHRLLVPTAYPGCRVEALGECNSVRFQLTSGTEIIQMGPSTACALIGTRTVDSVSLGDAILLRLQSMLPENVQQIRLQLRTEQIEGACYQYSHGLKHHDGNCQRIAHGHRSRIEIYRYGERSPQLEAEWAQRWCDIYLGTRSDLEDEYTRDGIRYFRFGYTAGQGRFALIIPQTRCYLIDSDTTVENLAAHLCSELQRKDPQSHYRVVAYEGVAKGAISESARRPL